MVYGRIAGIGVHRFDDLDDHEIDSGLGPE